MTTGVAILVSGARDHTNVELIEGALRPIFDDFWGRFDDPCKLVLIHGDATGADAIADHFARRIGFHPVAFPAPWKSADGRRAGPCRNGEMVGVILALEYCLYETHVLAFPLQPPRRGGTWDLIKKARNARLNPKVFR